MTGAVALKSSLHGAYPHLLDLRQDLTAAAALMLTRSSIADQRGALGDAVADREREAGIEYKLLHLIIDRRTTDDELLHPSPHGVEHNLPDTIVD